MTKYRRIVTTSKDVELRDLIIGDQIIWSDSPTGIATVVEVELVGALKICGETGRASQRTLKAQIGWYNAKGSLNTEWIQ